MTTSAGVVTVLFTDVVGSTQWLDRLGDNAAEEVRRTHVALLRRAVAETGGREVKSMGDGLMVAFTSPLDALRCAVTMQRAVADHNHQAGLDIQVRIGVHAGEPIADEGDLYGTAVVVAKRLCDRARGGQILAGQMVADLVGSRGGFGFRSAGLVPLKGLARPLATVVVDWSPAPSGAAAIRRAAAPRPRVVTPKGQAPPPRVTIASNVDLLGLTPFVGREHERSELMRLMERAAAGQGALAMIGGEPGVGKTRLSGEIAEHGRRRGFGVFTGHCYESQGDLPYMPWVEMIQTAARETPPELFREALGDDAPEVARIVPELRRLFPDIPPPLELPPDQQRRYIFNGIRNVMARVAATQPRLYILEDLHWADASTLLLLEHVAERLTSMPVLIVGTYRDPPIDVSLQLAETLSTMVRRRDVRLIGLRRHSEEEVEALLRALSGQAPPKTVQAVFYGETEGNAFFVEELFRHLTESGRLLDEQGRFRGDLGIGELDVPANVRLVTGQRLQRLSETTQRTLAIAAVAGRRVSFELLEEVAEVKGVRLIDTLDEAERARLIITETEGAREDYWFAHELIRQTFLAALPAARRRRHHLRVADALERVFSDDLPAQSAAIAQHLIEAGSLADQSRLFRHLVLAGKYALESAAFEDALRHFDRASLVTGAASPAEWAELLFDLGMARRSTGAWDTAVEAWRLSADAYEKLGDAEAVGRVCAAASYNLAWLAHWGEAVEMSQRGLAASGKRMNPDRGRLLGMAGCMTAWAGQYHAGNEMIDEELHLAAQLGDGNLLAHALSMRALARHIHMEYREVVEAGRRATKVLHETGDLWTLASVTGFMAFGLVYLGRFDEFPALDREFGPLAERLGNDGAIMCFRRMRALIDYFTTGDLDRLDALAHADREFCESAGLPWVSSAWSWAALARFLRGDWDHALELFREAVRLEPPGILSGWNAAPLFECLAYRGEKDAAMGLLDERDLPAPGEPKPWGATAMLVTAVDGLVVLGERDRAAALYPSVVDVMDRTGTVCSAYDDARLCERAAGIAAMAGRRWEAAEAHFRRALHQAAELPHRPEHAHTRRWYGQMLLERGGPGDRDRAERILHQALEDYRSMGMPRHCELAALRSRLGDVATQTTPALGKSRFPDSLTAREVEVLHNLAGGLTSSELAAKLHLSVATVHKHIANIYGKIGARNRAEATAYAFTHQLADPGDT